MADTNPDLIEELVPDQGTYAIRDLIGWQRDGTLELRPQFQRDSVWNAKGKSFLIDSIVRGFPIPLIVLQNEERGGPTDVIRRVVDGQQRLRTMIAFIEPDLLHDPTDSDDWLYYPLTSDGRSTRGYRFGELPPRVQNRVLSTRLSVSTVETIATIGQVLEIYDRLNSTGSPLTAQELRYARRDGRFSDLCYRLARRHQSRWTDWRILRDSEIARMKDVEFTSELVLLLMFGVIKTGRKEIDEAYTDYAEAVPDEEQLEARFDETMSALDDALARPPGRDPLKAFRSRGWFYILFAWQAEYEELEPGELQAALTEAAGKLNIDRRTNPELIRAISGSASDKASRDARYEYLADALEGILS